MKNWFLKVWWEFAWRSRTRRVTDFIVLPFRTNTFIASQETCHFCPLPVLLYGCGFSAIFFNLFKTDSIKKKLCGRTGHQWHHEHNGSKDLSLLLYSPVAFLKACKNCPWTLWPCPPLCLNIYCSEWEWMAEWTPCWATAAHCGFSEALTTHSSTQTHAHTPKINLSD